MGLLDTLEAPFKWIGGEAKSLIDKLVPQSLRDEIGQFAHTFTANVVHDLGDEAKTLSTEAVEALWTEMKKVGSNLAAVYLKGGTSFGDLIKLGVTALKSDAATVLLPELKAIGETTLTSWLPNLVTTAVAAASANPTSQPASSSAAPSSGQSKQ